MNKNFLNELIEKKNKRKKSFAVLLDPDTVFKNSIDELIKISVDARVDYFFIGGSLVVGGMLDKCLQHIKNSCSIPTVLFPGNASQVSKYADALLYLSLISGRNADFLIGQHVVSAPIVKQSGLEIVPTGYMVVDGGVPTSVSYISNAFPIPSDKSNIAVCTAIAGELLGLKTIYMDAGSGAKNPISKLMIEEVAKNISLPLIIGGGIKTPDKAKENCIAGANVIVVGNAIEKNSSLITEISSAIHEV